MSSQLPKVSNLISFSLGPLILVLLGEVELDYSTQHLVSVNHTSVLRVGLEKLLGNRNHLAHNNQLRGVISL